MIQVNTGEGKGKTTAALGQALRALGHGLKVCYVYFHKDPEMWHQGEMTTLARLGVEMHGFAKRHPRFCKDSTPEQMRTECLEGLAFIERLLTESSCDLLILDEINIAVHDGFIEQEELLDLLDKAPEKMVIVLTGRGALPAIIEKADLVSEITNVKHHFDKGQRARKGVEF